MAVDEHRHKWEVFKTPNKLICNVGGCATVSEIDVLLANTAAAAAMKSKLKVLSDQLFARELKKPAHEAAYAWIRQNAPDSVPKDNRALQGVLV